MLKNIPVICSAAIIAVILFQSALIAPAVNKIINVKEASVFLRFVWPKFFLIIALISLVAFISTIFYNTSQNLPRYFFVISFVLMLSCYFITPLINEAKDSSNEQLWTILHMCTILLTLITLVLNVSTLYFLRLSE